MEEVCASVDGLVIPANYNSDGQVVISGEKAAVEKACELLKAAGAKRALPPECRRSLPLTSHGARAVRLAEAIEKTEVKAPVCPIYQNVNALPETDPVKIKENLLKQLTSPVRWTQTVKNMIADGAVNFKEFGPGAVLQGLIKRIAPSTGVEVTIL